MIVKGKPNTKKVIVKTEDGEVYKTFNGGEECANFLGITRASVYNRASFPHVFYKTNGIKLSFTCVKHIKDTKEEGETNDQIRRRLELNPYGEWRNDEWLNAMMERVNKELYPYGYDEHMAWLSWKGKLRLQKGQRRESEEERLAREIDEEFDQYTK